MTGTNTKKISMDVRRDGISLTVCVNEKEVAHGDINHLELLAISATRKVRERGYSTVPFFELFSEIYSQLRVAVNKNIPQRTHI